MFSLVVNSGVHQHVPLCEVEETSRKWLHDSKVAGHIFLPGTWSSAPKQDIRESIAIQEPWATYEGFVDPITYADLTDAIVTGALTGLADLIGTKFKIDPIFVVFQDEILRLEKC